MSVNQPPRPPTPTGPQPRPPLEQRRFICANIDELSRQDATDVYRFIAINHPKAKFSVHADGCSVDLDKLPNAFIEQLYAYVQAKLDAEQE